MIGSTRVRVLGALAFAIGALVLAATALAALLPKPVDPEDLGRSLIYSDGEYRINFFASDAETGRITQIIFGPA